MLDELGLDKRDSDGFRLRSDGETLTIVLEFVDQAFAGSLDQHELVKDDWEAVGVKTVTRVVSRELYEERNAANQLMFGVWGWGFPIGLGMHGPAVDPPSQPYANWYLSGGKDGIKPPDGDLCWKIWDLWDKVQREPDSAKGQELWLQIRDIHKEQLWRIGVCGLGPALYITKDNFRNMPRGYLITTLPQYRPSNASAVLLQTGLAGNVRPPAVLYCGGRTLNHYLHLFRIKTNSISATNVGAASCRAIPRSGAFVGPASARPSHKQRAKSVFRRQRVKPLTSGICQEHRRESEVPSMGHPNETMASEGPPKSPILTLACNLQPIVRTGLASISCRLWRVLWPCDLRRAVGWQGLADPPYRWFASRRDRRLHRGWCNRRAMAGGCCADYYHWRDGVGPDRLPRMHPKPRPAADLAS